MRNKQILEMMNEIGEKVSKQKATIKNWKVELLDELNETYILTGLCTNHPNLPHFDSSYVETSKLLSVDFKNKTAETINTIYTLE